LDARSLGLVSLLTIFVMPLALGACGGQVEPSDGMTEAGAPATGDEHKTVQGSIEPCPIEVYDVAKVNGKNLPGDPDPCEEPPPPPPPPVPLAPSAISYPSYTTRPSFTVGWSGTWGWDDYYTLEELRSSGYWQVVYEGQGLSYSVTEVPAGVYRYRVRTCNSWTCSDYTWGPNMLAEPVPAVDLYSEFPFLYVHDQENALYTAQNQGFRVTSSEVSTLGPVNGMMHLGQGYNQIAESYAQICLDTAHPSFQIVTNPVNTRSMSINRASSMDHLAQLLDINMSGGLNLGVGQSELDLAGKKSRFTDQISDIFQETIVVEWEQQIDHWTLNTIADPLKPDFVNVLIPNNKNAQLKFRERCGDQYVYAVTRGAKFYMVFKFDAKRFSSVERAQQASSLAFKIQSSLSVNGSSSVNQETRQLLESLGVVVKGYSVGGVDGFEVGIDRNNFASRFQGFVNSVTVGNAGLVGQSLAHYMQPAQYMNYDYFEVFADYQVPRDQMARWNMIDIERVQRCQLANAYGSSGMASNCSAGSTELGVAKRKCLEMQKWSQCSHPLSYYPTNVYGGGIPANTTLYQWLGEKIRPYEQAATSQYFDHHVSSSWGSKKCLSFADQTCLRSSECVRDFSRGARGAFDFYLYEWDGPGNGSGQGSYTWGHCVRTDSTLCTSQFGDSTADFKFTQTVYGLCPTTEPRPFPIVP
jgi:hypothetical protein